MQYTNITILFLISTLLVLLLGVKTTKNNGILKTQIVFPEIYTNSVKYSITGNSNITESSTCRFVNAINNNEITCPTPDHTCSCSYGELVDLLENTIYDIKVLLNNEQIVIETVKTASSGQLTVISGLDYINYTIKYSSTQKAPFSCSAVLTSLESNSKIVSESKLECQQGKFDNLSNNRTYELVIVNNDYLMNAETVTTKYYNLTLNAIGLESFWFSGEGNFETALDSECTIIDTLTNITLNCTSVDGPCNCFNSTVTNLTIDKTYSLELQMNNSVISKFQLRTASRGYTTYETYFNGIRFNISFDDPDATPTHCYPCTFDTYYGDMSEEECREWVIERNFKEIYCQAYKYSDLSQNHYYRSILFDSFGSVISSSESIRVPKSEIVHTSYQLTSINYLLDTELAYDSSRPCYILDFYGDRRTCQVNGVNTTDCPCKEGKIIQLPINAYINVELYQDEFILAFDSRMYTADNGYLYLNSIGLYHFEYLVKYYYNTYPPFKCQACIQNMNLENKDCSDIESVFGREICRTYKWSSLQKATPYRVKLYDGDHVLQINGYAFTNDFPISAHFENLQTTIKYSLAYLNQSFTPFNCHFFFLEDPTQEASCFDNSCDCSSGSIQIPAGKYYRELVITDDNYEFLAKYSSSDNTAKLSTGGIVGIVIFTIICAIIVTVTTVLVVLKKRPTVGPQEFYNSA